MSSDLFAFIRIARPQNLLILLISVFTGALVTGTLQPFGNLALACLSAICIMAGGNAINDYFDIDIDRINKVFRPLPSGQLTVQAVRNFTIFSFVLGIFLSIFISKISFFLAVVAAFFLIIYSAKLKRTVLAGNITVSLVAALAFVYGGVAVGRIQDTFIPAGFALLFHLGREILKDIEDREADRAVEAQTLPVRYGVRTALSVVSVVFFGLIVFSFILKKFSFFWNLLSCMNPGANR